jgi:hypothetical protein
MGSVAALSGVALAAQVAVEPAAVGVLAAERLAAVDSESAARRLVAVAGARADATESARGHPHPTRAFALVGWALEPTRR